MKLTPALQVAFKRRLDELDQLEQTAPLSSEDLAQQQKLRQVLSSVMPEVQTQLQKRLDLLDILERQSKIDSNIQFSSEDRNQQAQLRQILLPQMTDNQRKFYFSMLTLRFYEEKEDNLISLTQSERDKKDQIETQLYGLVHFYAISLISAQSKSFRKDSDFFADLQQELQLIFCKHLYEYNPLTSAPTTFFKRHWVGGIARFLTTYSQRMTAHEARTISQVRKAAQELEKQGIAVTVTMISDRTGISPKRVQNAIRRAKTSIWACVDDDSVRSSLRASIATPEKSCITDECSTILAHSVDSVLSAEEQEFLWTVFDPWRDKTGTGFLPYKEIARIYNIPVYMAKQRLISVIRKLRACPDLKDYYHADDHSDIDTKLHLASPTAFDDQETTSDFDQGFDESLFDDEEDAPAYMESFASCKKAVLAG